MYLSRYAFFIDFQKVWFKGQHPFLAIQFFIEADLHVHAHEKEASPSAIPAAASE